MKKHSIPLLGAALALLFTLGACTGTSSGDGTLAQNPQALPKAAAPEAPKEAPEAPEWELNPAEITDDFAADTLIRLPELALSGLGFTFETPQDLTSQQLYLLSLAWAEPEALEKCYREEDGLYLFDSSLLCSTLDRYLEGYSFDLTQCPLYDAGRDAIATPVAGAFGGDVTVQLEDKAFDGNTVTLTALLDGSVRKTYTVAFYDGGYRYRAVRLLEPATARPGVGALQLDGEVIEAFAAVTDEERCLWDAASGGRRLAVARFPSPLSGAKDALLHCDFSDLDGDGNSELTAEFTFQDRSTASLVWFYLGGGLVYNEEFSRLPGEPAAGDDAAG